MMSTLDPASEILTTAQTVLFDAGRWLLTGAVTLFLGYTILMVAVLLLSALVGIGARSPKAPSPRDEATTSPGVAHGAIAGVVATAGLRPVGDRS